MALSHSPSVVTDGLVLYCDMSNTKKSFKGAPTTNSVPSADTMSGWNNYYRTLASSTFITEFGTTGYRFINQPSWNGVSRGITIPSTGTYTFSAWFRYLGGSAANNGATVYISGWGGSDSAVALNKSIIGVWQRISITLNCSTTSMTFYTISFGGTDNGTGNPDFSSWEVTMPQAEPGTYATPYVNGTRSNTQALVDLTGNNTVTASSLTYAADNTFSFNGTTDFVYADQPGGFLNSTTNNFFADVGYAWTVNAWFKFPIAPTTTRTGNSSYAILGNGGGIGGGETLTLFVGSGTDSTYGAYVPYYCAVGIRGTKTIISPSPVNTNTWNNAVVTWDGSAARVYFNGVDRGAASTATGAVIQNGYYFNIGMTGTAGTLNAVQLFEGSIGVTQVYSRALTAAEVSRNFNALRGRYGL